ncbi:MAG: tetratricopeptide repeat-containing sensor histidine kinase [Cytophagales bacterium]|nr:tetratricopeptide repeat-containing sensor histidine kinase [Cytophagales bacterium]
MTAAAQQQRRIDSLQTLLKTLPPDTNRVYTGIALFRMLVASDPQRALPYVREALALSQKLRDPKAEGGSYANMGIAYDIQSDFTQAMECYFKALRIYEKIGYQVGLAIVYNNLANTYSKRDDLDEALSYYRRSLELKRRFAPADKVGIGHSLNNIATIYDRKKDFDQALRYYLEALEVKRETKDKRSLGYTLSNIGIVYEKRGQSEKCLEYQRKALPLFEEVRENVGIATAYSAMQQAYLSLNQPEKVIEYGEKGLEMARKLGSKLHLEVISGHLAEAYSRLKNYEKAYENLSWRTSLKDSLNKEQDLRKYERLKAGYELEKQQIANEALQKDNRLKAAENLALLRDQQAKEARLQLTELSLEQQSERRMLEKLNFDREMRLKQVETARLRKEQQAQQTELLLKAAVIRQQYAWGAVVGVALLSLGVLSFVLYRNNRAKRRDNELLSRQKEEIHQQNRRLEELNAIKDKLFSIVSHDFRSPLNSLQGLLVLLQSELLTEAEMKQLMVQLSERLGVTLHLLENLLNWASSQMEGLRVRATTFDLKALAEENVRLAQGLAAKKRISLVSHLDESVPVHADKDMVNLVIRNLVTNAVKFTRPEGQIVLSAAAAGKLVRISVHDTGLGIARENIGKLFSTATAFTTPGTAYEKGTGLGLTLCKDFVVRNGGDIWVESEEGKGSVFTFTLPLAEN